MEEKAPEIENELQDRSSLAWKKLCEYVEEVAAEGKDEFSPLDALGRELYAQIYTLPESIAKLKQVKKIGLYGSKLRRIPPEIGEMESLQFFDPYTSYDLHWFPYEIKNCEKIKSSRLSTRALLGNYKNRKAFPSLISNPVRYFGAKVNCSICKKEMEYEETKQVWTSQKVGLDVLPLLANLCSKACEAKIPESPKGYIAFPHQGGADLKQPSYEEWEDANVVKLTMEEVEEINNKKKIKNSKLKKKESLKFLKFIRKIWEK